MISCALSCRTSAQVCQMMNAEVTRRLAQAFPTRRKEAAEQALLA
jgi:hypothetical protein